MKEPARKARIRVSTLTIVLLVGGSVVGCAQTPAAAPSATATPQPVQCGSTNIYEPDPDGGVATIQQALKAQIAWLAEVGVKHPPSNGQETFSLYPELNTMEVALAAFEAGRVERRMYRGREIVKIHAIDTDGTETGEVVLEELESGFVISQVVVSAGIGGTVEDCQ